MNLGSIWDRFGSIWGLGRIFGGFGAPWSAQDRILIDFRSILGPLVGQSRHQLGSLEASWGVLWLSLGSRESFYFRSHFRSIFGLHFASILDPKTTPKSLKNQTKSFAKTKKEKDLFRCFFHWNFKRFWCWSQKGRSSKTMQKLNILVHFLNMCLCRQRTETFWKPMQKSITNQSQNRWFFLCWNFDSFRHRCSDAKFWSLGEHLGLDFGVDLGPSWPSWRVLGASCAMS